MGKITMSHLPERVRVGPFIYNIVNWDPVQASRSQRYGETDHLNDRTIRVDTTHGSAQAAETLLHELLHAIWGVSGIGQWEELEEEQLVTAQAVWLAMLIQDNPEVWGWIQQNLNAEKRSNHHDNIHL